MAWINTGLPWDVQCRIMSDLPSRHRQYVARRLNDTNDISGLYHSVQEIQEMIVLKIDAREMWC
jgi:hypothetical protein